MSNIKKSYKPQIQISGWNNANFVQPNTINFLAAGPKSGKSYLVRSTVKAMAIKGAFDYGVVVCPTAHINGDYGFMPDDYVHTEYSDDIIKDLMDRQSKNKTKRAFLILDDCIGSIRFEKSLMSKLITTYRHYRLTIFITTQYCNSIPPLIRDCCTNTIIFYQFSTRSIHALKEAFLPDINKDDDARRFIEENTQDYHFIFVRNQERPGNRYFKIKAPPGLPRFKLNF